MSENDESMIRDERRSLVNGFRSSVFSALVWGTTLLLGGLAFFTLYSAVTDAKLAPRRSQCKNNLKQIGLALHNYHDQYGSFPPAFVADELGRPMHSWRVLLLPFLDEMPLYNEYRFDEPWDGPNNRKLTDRMVKIYTCPSEVAAAGTPASQWTSYVAVLGPQTIWTGTDSLTLGDIQDGLSSTLLVVEVANSGIHWMEPRDLHVVQMAPTINAKAGQGISSRHTGGAHGVMADGSVRFISETLPAERIRALLTIQGGEEIPDDF